MLLHALNELAWRSVQRLRIPMDMRGRILSKLQQKGEEQEQNVAEMHNLWPMHIF